MDDSRQSGDGIQEAEDWMSGFADDIFKGGKQKMRQTRKKKCEERYIRGLEKHAREEEDRLDMSPEEMKRLQASDSTLKGIREVVEAHELKSGVGFFRKNGLLYRRWEPKGRDKDMFVEQLVLPQKYRNIVMKLAHGIPLAGHLGKNQSTDRVLQQFYWPTVHRDVARYCQSCASCQQPVGSLLGYHWFLFQSSHNHLFVLQWT